MSNKSKFLMCILFAGIAISFLSYATEGTKITYLQLSTYDNLATAKFSQTKLAGKKLPALHLQEEIIQGKKNYALILGPFTSQSAVTNAENLLAKNHLHYLIQSERLPSQHLLMSDKSQARQVPATIVRQSSIASVPTIAQDTIANLFKNNSLAALTPKSTALAPLPVVTQAPSPEPLIAVNQITPSMNAPNEVPLPASVNYAVKVKPEPTRLWNLRNVDIHSVIQEVSRETGKNFIVDPRVQGQISIVSSTPINADAVYRMFLSALDVLGYSAISQGNVVKIVPSIEAKTLPLPIANNNNPGSGDEPVVRVIGVQNVSAEQLVPLLRPLIPDWGSLVAYGPSNVLIIAGNAANVSRVAQIIQRVDTTNTDGIDVMPLRYATAGEVVKTIQQLQSNNINGQNNSAISIAAESQSNTVLIGGPRYARLKMRILISELDTPSANGSNGNTQVVDLHYLQARDVVPILAGVAQSYGSSVGTVIGTITRQVAYSSNADNNSSDNQSTDQSSSSGTPAALPAPTQNSNPQALTSQLAGQSDKPRVEIIGEPNTNSIIINAPPSLMTILKAVIRQLDTRPAQVLVEAMVAEVDEDASARLGIQWGSVVSTGKSGVDIDNNGTTAAPVFQQGIGIINGRGIHNIQGVIQALANDNSANILSTPSIVVLDNHEAKIEVGQQISVIDSNFPNNAGGTTNATPYNTFNQEKVALHLYVTPTISQKNTIQLSIDQGNNTLQNPLNPTVTPIINISSIQTSVLVNSGDILVLGGLIQNQVSKNDAKIPILGDIPIIGHLFGVAGHGRKKQMLMVFIRPIILHNLLDNNQVTKHKYNFARNEQLSNAQRLYYQHNINQTILPRWGRPAPIPTPFAPRPYIYYQPHPHPYHSYHPYINPP